MTSMITVREVESGNIHTSVDKSLKTGDIPTGWSKSTDDLGLAERNIGGTLDTFEGNV